MSFPENGNNNESNGDIPGSYMLGHIAIASDVVPALTAPTVYAQDNEHGGWQHRLGPIVTEDERLSISVDAMYFYRIGETGMSEEERQARLNRYADLTRGLTARNNDTVQLLICTALAVFDPDKEKREKFISENFPINQNGNSQDS